MSSLFDAATDFVKATEKIVRTRPCPWCDVPAGELCRVQPLGGRTKLPALGRTHLGRFPTNVQPADFLLLSDSYAATIP